MQPASQASMDTGSEGTASGPSSFHQAAADTVAAISSAQAQAYIDSLAAAFQNADMAAGSVGLSAALLQATPVCLPLAALETAKVLEDLSMNPPVPTVTPSLAGVPLVPAAAPAGPSLMPLAGTTVPTAALVPAAVGPAIPAVVATPAATVFPAAAAAAPGAAALLQTAALQSVQAAAVAAAAAAGAAQPTTAVTPAAATITPAAAAATQAAATATAAVPVSPTSAAAAAAESAGSVGTPAPPTASNVAALNAAAAAAATPPVLLQSGGSGIPQTTAPTSAALLSSAGLQQATAYVPTGASAAQVAAGMPEVQAVQVLIPTGTPSNTASTASTLSTASAIQNAVASQQAAAQNVAAMQNAAQNVAAMQSAAQNAAAMQSAAQNAAAMQNAAQSVAAMQSAAQNVAAMQNAAQNAAAVQNALANQRMALAGLMSQAPNSSAMSALSGQTLAGQTLGNTINPNAMMGGLGTTYNPNALGLGSAGALAGVSAGMLGVGSPVSSGLTGPLSYVPSDASLQNLKSMSVASSVLSGHAGMDPSGGSSSTIAAHMAAINAAAAAAAAGAAQAVSGSSKKVRILLSSGGVYEEMPGASQGSGNRAARWRYVGGETRLVGLTRTNSFSHFLQQLSKATSAVWDDSCRLMYDLPGADGESGTLIDLLDDDDLEMMWEELDSFTAVRPSFRLHIYAQLGSKRGSAEGSSGTIPSADSNVIKEGGSAGHHRASTGTTGTAPDTGTPTAGDGPVQNSSTFTLTSSEYEDLVEDLVTESPKVSLADLEARLEIIKPEDLQPLRLLGTGGFGEVYLCHWHSCDVAVKCLNPNLLVPDGGMGSISKDNVSELLKEAALLGSVRHPNIVWVYGLVLPAMDPTLEAVRSHLGPGQEIDAVKMATQMANKHRQETPGMSQVRPPALVTEYLASGSLRAAITRRADFLSRDSVRIKLALDAARGMDYLHSKHIVHFDLKTANLLVGMRDKTPICKVADFGLSKQKQQTYVTGVATLRGTLPWIAPEIIKTPGTCTEAVDVYSFGVVLWELWTLREPFEGINYHALLHMMSSSPDAVKPAMPGTPEYEGEAPPEPAGGWADLVTECLATSVDARPRFRDIVGRLESMMRANRMAKRRAASSPAAGTGTPGLAATGVSAGL